MAIPEWQRVKELFVAASALPPAGREAFVRAQCAADPELGEEVLSLLAASPPTEAPPPRIGLGGEQDQPPEEAGDRIGPYRLLQRIGEGGFGVVYAAEQEHPIRRRVALKIVKAGMDSRQVVARFEQERQALALMDNPNIARVFDGGTTPGGRPFFVMELVRGDPITEYCDRERLAPDERLRLVVEVARAVQHAHQKGVIHRDLKPSNVLVTLIDGRAVPKVIDFGVAKATQGRLTEHTLFTEHKQMLGTPLYMSPEQAHNSGVDVDTRSDVYSLGVLLYELLTGTTPFRREELLDAGLLEMHRVLREVEPQKPSTRVATLGATSGVVAAQRRVAVEKLGTLLRGDLDWIVMKCLEKERGRRYESANDLARDIERHLATEPVLAAPPSVGYRVRRYVRRRKGLVAAAAVVTVVAAFGVTAFVWSERSRAEDATRATQQQEFMAYVANVQAANAALINNDVRTARARLTACPEHLRHWEWHYLDALGDRSEFVLAGHAGPVVCVAYDGAGARVVTASQDGTARLWNSRTGEAIAVLHHAGGAVHKAAFSPDGQWVATVSERAVSVWHASTHNQRMTVEKATDFDWAPDGSTIATITPGTATTLWNTVSWTRELEAASLDRNDHVVFSPDGQRMVTWSRDFAPNLLNTASGARITTLTGVSGTLSGARMQPRGFLAWTTRGQTICWSLADGQIEYSQEYDYDQWFSTEGLWLAARKDGQVDVMSVTEMGGDSRTLTSHKGPINFAAELQDRTTFTVVTAGSDGTAMLWEDVLDSPRRTALFLGHTARIEHSALRSDQRQLATASADCTCRLWNLENTWESRHQPWTTDDREWTQRNHIAFSPDSERILLMNADRIALIHSPTARVLAEKRGSFEAAAWCNESSLLSVENVLQLHVDASADTAVDVRGAMRRRDGTSAEAMDELSVMIDGCSVEALGDTVILCDAIGRARAWSFARAREVFSRAGISCLAIGTGSLAAMSESGTGTIELVSLETGLTVCRLPSSCPTTRLSLSPDGTLLASLGSDQELTVWNIDSRTTVMVVSEVRHQTAPSWSVDSRRLAIDTSHGTTIVDFGRRTLIPLHLQDERGTGAGVPATASRTLAFSPDGKRLLTTEADGSEILIFDTGTGEEMLLLAPSSGAGVNATFSPDGNTIVSMGNCRAALYDAVPHRRRLRECADLTGPSAPAGVPGSSESDDASRAAILTRQFRQHREEQETLAQASAIRAQIGKLLLEPATENPADLASMESLLRQAIQLDPFDNERLLGCLAVVLWRQNRHAECARLLDTVFELDEFPTTGTLLLMAIVQARLGDREQSSIRLNEAIGQWDLHRLTNGLIDVDLRQLQQRARAVFDECFPDTPFQPKDK